MNEADVSGHIRAFQEKHPVLTSFCESLKGLIRQLLDAGGVEYVAIEGRAKTVESFTEKIQRAGKAYGNPLSDLTDLVGIRVIAYQLSAIDRISEIVRANFLIDEENSVDKGKLLETDRFGYQSVHFIAELNKDRKSLPEYRAFSGIKCEIQIRTALQHAWAAINHKLLYKAEVEVPKDLRRHFNRISALLETADADFEVLTEKIRGKTKEYKEKVKARDYDLPLNLDSLTVYFEKDPRITAILKTAEKAGIKIVQGRPHYVARRYNRLIEYFSATGDSTIAKIDSHFGEAAAIADKAFSLLRAQIKEVGGSPLLSFTKAGLLNILLILASPPKRKQELIVTSVFGSELIADIEAVYKKLHPSVPGKTRE